MPAGTFGAKPGTFNDKIKKMTFCLLLAHCAVSYSSDYTLLKSTGSKIAKTSWGWAGPSSALSGVEI